MANRSRRFLLVGVGLVAIFLLVLWQLTWPEPLPPLPDPNGYDKVVALGQQIKTPMEFGPDLDVAVLRETVETNREILEATRIALQLPTRVPWSANDPAMRKLLDDLTALRTLARLVAAEAKVAAHDQRWDDAADAYLDLARLGHACTRGAAMVTMLVGIAIESMGHDGLLDVAPHLNASTAERVMQQLVDLEERRETFDQVLENERRWSREAFPWHHHLMLSLSGQRQKLLQPAIDAGLAAHRRGRAMLQLVVLKIAIHQFEQREGRLPTTLEQLEYPAFPNAGLDPYTDKPLIYRPAQATYQLYSVGPNQKDDGGEGYDSTVRTQTTDDLSAWPEAK